MPVPGCHGHRPRPRKSSARAYQADEQHQHVSGVAGVYLPFIAWPKCATFSAMGASKRGHRGMVSASSWARAHAASPVLPPVSMNSALRKAPASQHVEHEGLSLGARRPDEVKGHALAPLASLCAIPRLGSRPTAEHARIASPSSRAKT